MVALRRYKRSIACSSTMGRNLASRRAQCLPRPSQVETGLLIAAHKAGRQLYGYGFGQQAVIHFALEGAGDRLCRLSPTGHTTNHRPRTLSRYEPDARNPARWTCIPRHTHGVLFIHCLLGSISEDYSVLRELPNGWISIPRLRE